MSVFAIALFRPDPVIDDVFLNLTIDSPYYLSENHEVNEKISTQGVMGKMLSCLKGYRGGSFRKPKYEAGKNSHKWIKVRVDKYLFWMRISASEVYSFSVSEIDNTNNVKSRSELYSVNCSLTLLNS